MDGVFEALASTPRRRILAYLSQAELTASDIAARFTMSAPAVSRHLTVLLNAGLVAKRREGQFVHYRIVREKLLNRLFDALVDFCPQGGPLKEESRKIDDIRRRLLEDKQ